MFIFKKMRWVVYIQKSQNTKTTKCFGMYLFFKIPKTKTKTVVFNFN